MTGTDVKQEPVPAMEDLKSSESGRPHDYAKYQDPLKLGVSPHSCNRARNFALARGWPGPLAWDDESIDDPKARPRGVERRAA